MRKTNSHLEISFTASILAAVALVTVTGTGCASRPNEQPVKLRASSFDVTAEADAVHLLYGVPTGKGKETALFYCRRASGNAAWSDPVPVPTLHAPSSGHHRGNDPQIAVKGRRAMALWTAGGNGPFGSGPLGTALSEDGGKSWKQGPTPSVGIDNGYRFPATVAGPDAFHVIWIHAEGEERSLRYSRLDYGANRWSDPVIVDPQCCACCWNELKIDAQGKLSALYRDEGPQDMALAILEKAGANWERVGSVGDFKWFLNGCPHVGGGLALASAGATANSLLATVWTGHAGWNGAYALKSADGGKSWKRALKLGTSGETGRHTDVAWLSGGKAAVVWDQLSEDAKTVHLALSSDGGETWDTAAPFSSSVRKGEYPRLVAVNDRFVMLWTEEDEGGAPLLKWEDVSPNRSHP